MEKDTNSLDEQLVQIKPDEREDIFLLTEYPHTHADYLQFKQAVSQ